MRFHFGLSFRPKSFLKYIGLGLIALLAFMGVHDFANAAEITVDEISAGDGSNNSIYCNSDFSNWCPNPYFDLQPPYTEYAPIKYINFDFVQPLTANHNYTFDIIFEVARPVSLNDFEQESFTFWPYSGGQLNDTTIVWNQQNTLEYQTGIYTSYFHYRGQFTPNTSSNGFYTRLTLEQNESVYGIIVLSTQLVDNDTGDALINANYENTQNIINNANSNTDNIINNNDSNTQEIIDNQNNLLGDTCSNLLDLSSPYLTERANYSLISNGIQINGIDVFGNVRYKIPIESGKSYTFKGNFSSSHANYVMVGLSYDINFGSWIYNFEPNTSFGVFSTTFTASSDGYVYLALWSTKGDYPNTATFYNLMFSSESASYCKYGSFISKLDSTNQSLEELNDTITDETLPDIDDSTFGDLEISSDSAISDLITMPITILQALNNNLGNTCSPYTIPFGLTGGSQTLTFPCINPEEYLGSTIWNYIDLFICFFMVYNIAMLIISSFESITSLEDTFNSLYEPRHADTGYKPKHGGD